MTIAKGLSSGYMPIGGVLISDRVAEVVIEGGEFAHGYTYSGHPVAAAVASANLSIIEDEGSSIMRQISRPTLQRNLVPWGIIRWWAKFVCADCWAPFR